VPGTIAVAYDDSAPARRALEQAVHLAAQRCFTRNGFQATSMQDIFAEAGLSAGSVYSHFTGKRRDHHRHRRRRDRQDHRHRRRGPPRRRAARPDQALEGVLATLQQAHIAPIAVIIWGEAIRDPALSHRLSALYRHLADHFTKLVRISQERGTTDPGTPPNTPRWS
jgi:AcrR family transcriptional regulator